MTMEEGQKKLLMIAAIVVCLGVAAALTVVRSGGDSRNFGQFEGQQLWLKCGNQSCGNEWQMPKKEYFEFAEKNQDPTSLDPPAVTCPKCNQASGYRAEKCEKCGKVFFRGTVLNDYSDRCPDCGFSKQEEERKQKAAGK